MIEVEVKECASDQHIYCWRYVSWRLGDRIWPTALEGADKRLTGRLRKRKLRFPSNKALLLAIMHCTVKTLEVYPIAYTIPSFLKLSSSTF
jgi:hypothetical protein